MPERILVAAGARQWALTLSELRSEAHKTAATVRMVMSRALSFMADPALAASVLPKPGEGFDIPAFLDQSGTVYMIAEAVSEEAPVASLFAAMATEIHYAAAQIGQASESRRLDPPLLDTRITTLSGRLIELTGLITSLAATPHDDADADRHHPDPAPAWWKLPPADRAEPLARLRAWVEQVYRPGYGHLAATLAPCWEAHDLCLYALDITSALWSVLYLQPDRTPGLLSAQAEYQARILPALAAQLMTETTRCAHPRTPASVRSTP